MSSINCLQRSRQVNSCSRQHSSTARPTRATVVCNAAGSTTAASRRELLAGGLISANAVLLGQLAGAAYAEEDAIAASVADQPAEAAVAEVSSSSSAAPTSGAKQVFFDIKVEGEYLGRIVVELVDDAAVGAQRFADLAQEKQGVGYRLSKIDGIFSTYIRDEGVKSLSYTADGSSLIAGGASVQALEDELAASSRRHDRAGLVSIVVREAAERPVKVRGGCLVAWDGARMHVVGAHVCAVLWELQQVRNVGCGAHQAGRQLRSCLVPVSHACAARIGVFTW
eukprot:GHRQ01017899.1.p1 GENE.GHRQ01017899.1~~GHRQ01017899.1.p1  ORF type:complete len:282 (+),score=76.79 GHRQ01017899.1:491-1336(+)